MLAHPIVDEAALTERFKALWLRCCSAPFRDGLWRGLFRCYTDPSRGHHAILHIAEMLSLLDQIRAATGMDELTADTMEWAIFYHDGVYNPAAKDNEKVSAYMFRKDLANAGAPPRILDGGDRLILSTAHGTVLGADDERLLHDIDYWIVGSPPDRYARYAGGVAREFIPVFGREKYVAGRRTFLSTLVPQEPIFLTPHFYASCQPRAMTNVAWELAQLDDPAYVEAL